MKEKFIILNIFLFILINHLSSTTIFFPSVNIYSQMDTNGKITTSYLFNIFYDTGIKYGFKIGIEMKNYNISNMSSNFLNLTSINISSSPIDKLYISYFIGDYKRLGICDFGYNGFFYHNRPNLEYLGFHTISGTGLNVSYTGLLNGIIEPYIFIYQPFYTNQINLDFLLKFSTAFVNGDVYFGINKDFSQLTNLNKRLGLSLKAKINNFDIQFDIFNPEDKLLYTLIQDRMYISINVKAIFGIFEQKVALFTRPYYYNNAIEPIREDIDLFLSSSLLFGDFSLGIENILTMSRAYTLSDRIGLYGAFTFNNLQYKIGANLSLFGTAFPQGLYFYIGVYGNL